jgi:hypothetical protein
MGSFRPFVRSVGLERDPGAAEPALHQRNLLNRDLQSESDLGVHPLSLGGGLVMLVIARAARDHEGHSGGDREEADRRGPVTMRRFGDSRHDLIDHFGSGRPPPQRAAQIGIQVHSPNPFRSISIDRRK